MNPELDKIAADIVEGLLKDLGDTFSVLGQPMQYIDADLYGWKVAMAEALADRLKKLVLPSPAMSSEDVLAIMERARKSMLRDRFATAVLQNHAPTWSRWNELTAETQEAGRAHTAKQCYLMADAMLRARNPDPQPDATVEAPK